MEAIPGRGGSGQVPHAQRVTDFEWDRFLRFADAYMKAQDSLEVNASPDRLAELEWIDLSSLAASTEQHAEPSQSAVTTT